MTAPFEPRGRISLVDACAELIQETAPKDGFSYDVALTEVWARTGLDDLSLDQIRGPMLAASKRLQRSGIPGVRNLRSTGWQRRTSVDLVGEVRQRERKIQRQARWGLDAGGSANPEELDWPDRHTLTETQRKLRAVEEMNSRRARRLRPLPPAAGE